MIRRGYLPCGEKGKKEHTPASVEGGLGSNEVYRVGEIKRFANKKPVEFEAFRNCGRGNLGGFLHRVGEEEG